MSIRAPNLLRWLPLAILPLALLTRPVAFSSDMPNTDEARVKAYFIIAFTKYVEWPQSSFSSADSPIVIGAFGRSPINGELKDAIAARSTVARPIVFRQLNVGGPEADTCHIILVNASDSRDIAKLIDSIQGKPVLTVVDSERLEGQGVIITLVRREHRLLPRVDLARAKASSLHLSSKLLAVSEVNRSVSPTPP